eukprot:3464114-Pleurochrysis_carterae.AAC.1
MAEWSQKEPPLKLATRDTAVNRKPAFWSSKVHGVPQGYKPKSTALALRRPDSAPIMRKANAIVAHGQKVGKGSSSAECDPDRLEEIEDQVRKKIIECTPALQEREQTILIRACSKFDEDGRGFITCEAFQKVLECLDVSATLSECRAVFSKYGQDVRGRMPYKVFANALFTSKNRLLAWTDIQHTVPFQLDDSHKQKLQDAFTGKIQYRKCVTGIYTPTKPGMWDADLIRASRQPPTARLQLEHVYGYTGGKHPLLSLQGPSHTDIAVSMKFVRGSGCHTAPPSAFPARSVEVRARGEGERDGHRPGLLSAVTKPLLHIDPRGKPVAPRVETLRV